MNTCFVMYSKKLGGIIVIKVGAYRCVFCFVLEESGLSFIILGCNCYCCRANDGLTSLHVNGLIYVIALTRASFAL